MRGKSMILIVIALGCGLVASIGISKILDRQKGGASAKTATKKVYVTVTDVNISEVFDADMVKLEEWPVDKVPEDAAVKLEDVVGLVPNQRFYEGEIVRTAKLGQPGQGTDINIPEGYRVGAVKVQSDSSVGGILQPGNHVDVQVYLRKSASVPLPTAKTILEDVIVFAVNAETEKQVDEDGRKINAKTVSLLVEPDQLRTLLLASKLGDISLSLRHPDDDTVTIADNGAGLPDLLNSMPQTGTPRDATSAENVVTAAEPRSDFTDFLKNLTPPAAAQQEVAEQPNQSEFLVQVILPDGITTYGLVNDEQISEAQMKTGIEGLAAPAPANVPDDLDQPFVDSDGSDSGDIDNADGDDSTADADSDA